MIIADWCATLCAMERLALRILAGLALGAIGAAALGPTAMELRWLMEPVGAIFMRLLLCLVLPAAWLF